MMTFYTAIGTCRIQTEDNMKIPYIQKLGRLHPISVPEFLIWSILLWQVMTYEELKAAYEEQMDQMEIEGPDFDKLLSLLTKRKLIAKGIGYTGIDALYNMLADAFIIPYRVSEFKRAWKLLRMCVKGRIGWLDLAKLAKEPKLESNEQRVIDLVEQTPLNTAELVRCFERGIHDVSTPTKVIEGIYTDEESDQNHIKNEEAASSMRNDVLQAVSNLYLNRRIILELA